MPERAFEKEFLDIATFLYNLANGNPHSQPSTEILLRTHVNRVYYYSYHTIRRETIHQILKEDTNLEKRVKDWHINLEDIFREHKLLRKFYEEIWKELKLDDAEDIADILNTYNTYRVLADYHIQQPNPHLGRANINFQDLTKTPNAWNLLNPSYIERKIQSLLPKIAALFRDIENSGYSFDTAKILLEIERNRQKI